ncbi:MAG TPA: trigger factor [Clostridia bacterium]
MSVKVENIEKNVVQLEIEVDSQKFEEGMKKSYSKNVKRFNVPGFRKGKAPRNIVERYYGEQSLYEDAFLFVYPEAYDAAIEENKLEPIERPQLDIKQIGSGQNLVFTAKVTVKPEVTPGNYKGVMAEKSVKEITDEMVEAEVNKAAEKNSRIITIDDRNVQKGDTVKIDFEGFMDGVAFEGGSANDFSLEIGSGAFIPGFEDQLIDAAIGSTVDVNVSFPEDYGKTDIAGKPALFKVTVKEIKVKELPVIDDEFAQDVSEFETLEEYKQDIKNKLVENAEIEARNAAENAVIKTVVDSSEVDVPRVLIERQIDRLVEDFDYRLRYRGMELQGYLEYLGSDIATFRAQFEENAASTVRTQLVIDKISKIENITASQEEFDQEINKLAENYDNIKDIEEFKKRLREDDINFINNTVVYRKTIEYIIENAYIIDGKQKSDE